jgi:hypothetical protein
MAITDLLRMDIVYQDEHRVSVNLSEFLFIELALANGDAFRLNTVGEGTGLLIYINDPEQSVAMESTALTRVSGVIIRRIDRTTG